MVPAHGRHSLAAICLRQLRRTCDGLGEHGIEATAVVIADRENLRELRRRLGSRLLGFGTITRDNHVLSQRYNDGIQLACDPRYNRRPAEYVVPCGSDDWVDYRLLLELPPRHAIYCFKHLSFVREDGCEIAPSFVGYDGGCGIRIYPRRLLAKLGYRPADEDRARGCDTSILTNLKRADRYLEVVHLESDPRQIVDWKSPEQQINAYEQLARWRRERLADPFAELAEIFPAESLQEMADHYSRTREREPLLA